MCTRGTETSIDFFSRNPRVVKDNSKQIIKDSIANPGCDDSTFFIICFVTDDNRLMDPVKVRNTPELLQLAIHDCVFVFLNGHHRDQALQVLRHEKYTKFPLPTMGKCQV